MTLSGSRIHHTTYIVPKYPSRKVDSIEKIRKLKSSRKQDSRSPSIEHSSYLLPDGRIFIGFYVDLVG